MMQEFYICLWQKFWTLEVSSFCLKPGIEEGPLYCGLQPHQWLLKNSFKSFWCTCTVKLDSPSFLGTTPSGIVGSTLLQSNWSRLIVRVSKVTAAFDTCKIHVAATLSGNKPLAMVASWTAQSLIRGSSWTEDAIQSLQVRSGICSESNIKLIFSIWEWNGLIGAIGM